MAAQAKSNIQLQPIKVENAMAYRDPVQTQTYPSPPYEANYDNYPRSEQPLYQNYPTAAANQNQTRQQLPTSQYTSTNQNAINQSNAIYSANHGSPYNNANTAAGYHQTMANQGSPSHQMAFESVAAAGNAGGNGGGDLMSQSYAGNSYVDVRQQRHSCDIAAKQHHLQQDLNSPYTQVSSTISPV